MVLTKRPSNTAILGRKIDWQRFDTAFADCYCPDFGAPAKAIRLLVGLHYLKHAFNAFGRSGRESLRMYAYRYQPSSDPIWPAFS